jgi:hypothetical protein
VISEDEIDFKYAQIVKHLDVEYRHQKYSAYLRWLLALGALRSGRRVYFHIRYLKWRGSLRTVPIYLALIVLSRLQGVRVVWTCHNVWEHRFPARWQNVLLRGFVCRAAFRVIVMHQSMGDHLPRSARGKLVAAHFGSMREATEAAARDEPPNADFAARYQQWCERNEIEGPDLVMVSASLTSADELFEALESTPGIRALLIAPGVPVRPVQSNVLHVAEPVYAEVHSVLSSGRVIGYLGHQNISVPTGIYMYAAYGVPILGKDQCPVKDLLLEHEIGEVFHDASGLLQAYSEVRGQYDRYRANCSDLLTQHTWEESARIHSAVFA